MNKTDTDILLVEVRRNTPLVNSLYKTREWNYLGEADISYASGMPLKTADLDNTYEGSALMRYVEDRLRENHSLGEASAKRLFITERESIAASGHATARTKIGRLTHEWRGVPKGTLIMRLVDDNGVEQVYAEKDADSEQDGSSSMSKERAELIAERDRVQEQINELEAREKALGATRVATTEFHNLMCHADHTEGCSWFYEKDEDFDREGSTHYRWLNRYQKAKHAVEEVIGDIADEDFNKIAALVTRA